MGLVSLQQAKNHLQISGDTHDAELVSMIEVASELCEAFVGGPLSTASVTERFDGGSSVLVLSKRPVLTVSSVTASGSTVSAAWYGANLSAGVIASEGGPFGDGPQDVAVTYTAGYAPVPVRAQHACLETLRHLWATQRGAMPRTSLNGDDYVTGMGWSLPRRVEELLDGFRAPGGG